jgi:hypothetical protein
MKPKFPFSLDLGPIGTLLLLFMLSMSSCKKKADDPTTGFSEQINTIAPKAIIDTLRKNGMIIHEGRVPPTFEGIYLFDNNILVSSSLTSDDYGDRYASYKYRFYAQDNQALTIKLDYKAIGVFDEAQGKGAFVSGNGSRFTAFVQVKGSTHGVEYEALDVYSGEVTATGIRQLQKSFVMTKKGSDPSEKLVPVGTYRIFRDDDGFSTLANSYRHAAQAPLSGKALLAR